MPTFSHTVQSLSQAPSESRSYSNSLESKSVSRSEGSCASVTNKRCWSPAVDREETPGVIASGFLPFFSDRRNLSCIW